MQRIHFAIDTATTTMFHVVPNDGTAPFSCTLAGAAFDCPNRAAVAYDLHPGLDAVITAHATASGELADATNGSGSQRATATCAGTQCSAVASFPCAADVSFDIVAQ